jgi:soluble lytic murein transglycosylase-like protein
MSGSRPTSIFSSPGVGAAGRLQRTFLLQPARRLWCHLERARKSLGVCSFGFLALSLVPVAGQGGVQAADPAADPATGSAQQCCPDATVPCAPEPEAVYRLAAPPAAAVASAAIAAAFAASGGAPLDAAHGAHGAETAASAAPAMPALPAGAGAASNAAPPAPAQNSRPQPARAPSPRLGFDRSLGVPRTPYGKQIYKIALRYALNPLMMAAVVEAESDFNPRAVSRKGACGLMQVLPSTARRFGLHRRRDLFNPLKNLETGARYLRWLIDRFGDDAARVLAAYNAGEGSVERFGGLPPFRETRDYVSSIFTRLGFTLLLPAVPASALPAVDPPVLAGTR